MSNIVVDIEADGPCPGLYSMVSFGAVIARSDLKETFYSGIIKPISDKWIPEALAVSKVSREEHLKGRDPVEVMREFVAWIVGNSIDRHTFYSDNNGFDWQFINYYMHAYYGSNPFGFSSQNIGSLYKGLVADPYKNFKHLRKTKHTHHPVDDAKGNAEALMIMSRQFGYNLRFN